MSSYLSPTLHATETDGVSDQQIWAPWRLSYIKKSDPLPPADPDAQWAEGADESCFVCRALAETKDVENLVVLRTEHTITLLNRYPYNNGHLLVCPHRHVARLDQLTGEEHGEISETLARLVTVLETILQSQGFNLGVNLGEVAGAGLPGHLHWHIVPRWQGDTNFMPVLGNVDVISQSLESLGDALREHLGSND